MARNGRQIPRKVLATAVAALLAPAVVAQSCISLAESKTCAAFNTASISTDSTLVGFYPFLASVSNTADFDRELAQYVSQGYVQLKYTYLFGCSNVDLTNTTDYYARYTTSFLCNGIIQNSRTPCGLSDSQSRPLCADSCAEQSLSEEQIVSDTQLCQGLNSNYASQLRADFTDCALPANSLTETCITGAANEPDNCGFGSNLMGLCNYCRRSTENATDSCCVTSNSTGRCQDVTLPVFSSIPNLLSTTSTSAGSQSTGGTGGGAGGTTGGGTGTPAGSGTNHHSGLSAGAIAGIVIGSVLGFLLLLGLLIFCCIRFRRRQRQSSASSILNQPSPHRKGAPSMSYNKPSSQQGYEVLPGGRVARMTALSGEDDTAPGQRAYATPADPYGGSPDTKAKELGALGMMGAAGAVGASKRDRSPPSDSQQESSPGSGDFSSPEGVASGQSEQLPYFKDYYSNDDIHPNDRVSVLWAYQPRAGDEFELERGDMLKVVGIWDDGWATGIRINDRAEDYEGKHKMQRDSGVSNGTAAREDSPTPSGEIKAFPLVCICLPEAWKKTVEGDASTDSGSGGPPPI